jgi:hypothetical protein
MPGRTLSLLACCFAGAACCLATTAARADEPIPKNPTALSVEVVVPDANGPAPKESAPAAHPTDTGSSILADTGAGFSNPTCAPRAHRFYASGEYLLWWFNTSPQPVPLVTSVPAALVPAGGANPGGIAVGSLLDPNASVVLGGRAIDTGLRSGARFTIGTWLDDNQRLGFEGSYFFIAPTTVTRSVSADGSVNAPLLSIPFFDVTGASTPSGLPGESARPIPVPPLIFTRNFPSATPGETAGVFTQILQSRLQGFELNGLLGLSPLVNVNGLRLNAIGGFRYMNLRESLTFSSAINAGPTGLPDFSSVIYNTTDQFTTHNDFYGGQMGLRGEYAWKGIVMQATAKVALGDVRQQVTINGSTLSTLISGPGTTPLNYAGGIFAQPSNIGSYSRDRFGVLPEFDVNVGYRVFDWARVFVGYSFLYLNNVTRPGNAIDRNINVTRIPFNTEPTGPALVPTGPAAPVFNFHDSSFWAQGINFGLEFRF